MYFNVCNTYRKSKKKQKKHHVFLSVSIIYSKCGYEHEKIFKEEESIEILKIIGLINNIEEYQKNIQSYLRKT